MAKKKKDPQSQPDDEDEEESFKEEKKKKKKDKGEKKEKEKEVNVQEETPEVETRQPKKAPKIMMTREIGKQYLDREKYLKLCLREMMSYLGFVLVVGMLAAGQHTDVEYNLSRAMTNLFIEGKFHAYSTGEYLNYNEINTLEQVWEGVHSEYNSTWSISHPSGLRLTNFLLYFFSHYLKYTYWDHWYNGHTETTDDEKMILYENRLIGRPRIRQLRVRKDSCKVPEDFKLMFAYCYSEYNSDTEDKQPFGTEEGTPWMFTSPDKLHSYPITGEVSTYGGGGFYFDFDEYVNATNATIRQLFSDLWLERGSRALIIQFTTYNYNYNLFFTLKLLLELPPTGGVLPSYVIYIEKFFMRDIWDTVLLVVFVIFVIYVLVYTVSELFEIFYFRLSYLNYFWNACDLVILILCYVTIGFFVYAYFVIESELEKLLKIKDKHACFDKINDVRENYITLIAVLFFFTAIKLLKYMNFNHSMFQMQMTLQKATKDIACFSIIFFIVFITFAQLGHLLFGSQVQNDFRIADFNNKSVALPIIKVRDFRSFVHSVFALLRTAVGDFDYHKIENVNHFLGPVYFFAYIFFIYFILVNMFLAIIIDTYSEVRTSIRDQAKEMQISDIVFGWMRKLVVMCGCRKLAEKHDKPMVVPGSTPYQDIQNLLRRCGFTEQEVDLFLQKFDIPKDKLISQEEMRQKLLSNFNMQPETDKAKGFDLPERDEAGEKLMGRIRILEDNITDVNYKIDLIDNKIDAIQQIRARRRTLAQEQKQ